MASYETYLKRFRGTHGHTKGAMTRYAYERYHGIEMTAERAGLKPGFITKGIKKRSWREILRGF